jgi:hypothetical protein
VNFWRALKVFSPSLYVVFLIRHLPFDFHKHIEVLFPGCLVFKIIRMVDHAKVKCLVLCWFNPSVKHLLHRYSLNATRARVSVVLPLGIKRKCSFIFRLLADAIRLFKHDKSPAMFLEHSFAQLKVSWAVILVLWVTYVRHLSAT